MLFLIVGSLLIYLLFEKVGYGSIFLIDGSEKKIGIPKYSSKHTRTLLIVGGAIVLTFGIFLSGWSLCCAPDGPVPSLLKVLETPTVTATATGTPTSTPTYTPTNTPTSTATPTSTTTPTNTPTSAMTATAVRTSNPTNIPISTPALETEIAQVNADGQANGWISSLRLHAW
jgi:hypothetical protein